MSWRLLSGGGEFREAPSSHFLASLGCVLPQHPQSCDFCRGMLVDSCQLETNLQRQARPHPGSGKRCNKCFQRAARCRSDK